MSLWIAIFIGVLQGATELFPVSSLGHAIVVPPLLGIGVRQSDADFVPFLVVLHLGTAGALIVLFRHEWVSIIRGFVRAATRGIVETREERLSMLLVVATVPAGLVGFLLEKSIKGLFASTRPACIFLIFNGAILLGAEYLRRRDERRAEGDQRRSEASYSAIENLSYRSALLIGACQALALLPGVSRSGVTMAGGLIGGLRHQEAARFSFLLATPIILAAGLLEIPDLSNSHIALTSYLAGGAIAAVVAYASARFLIRYFKTGRLDPYAYYCAGLGILGLALIR